MTTLSEFYRIELRDQEAKQTAREAARGLEAVLGPNHLDTLAAKHSLASAQAGLGELSEAQQGFEEIIDQLPDLVGTEHPAYFITLDSLAGTYFRQGRLLSHNMRALGSCGEAIENFQFLLSSDIEPHNPDVCGTRAGRGLCYLEAGLNEQARQDLDYAAACMRPARPLRAEVSEALSRLQ